jgi:hypothetical protein
MQRASGRIALDIAGEGEDLSFLTLALRIGICGGQAGKLQANPHVWKGNFGKARCSQSRPTGSTGI